jgi:C4-dicarboxylate-specific signal transduction histidine kinase
MSVLAALLFQSALIGWLIYEHRRRAVAEARSRQSMAELTYMNRTASAGLLSASIAHEVNQPLTGIVTRANAAMRWLSRETPEIDKAHAALTQIVEAGHRAADIIVNVKAMFRNDTQQSAPVDINKVIRSVLTLTDAELRRHDIESQIRLGEYLPLVVGNEIQLQQVILNLVMNAIEAMSSTRPRVLSIKSELSKNQSVHVSVEDTGSGIDPSDIDRVFKPMFTTKAGGMGMGLSICHSIIESHHGRMWVTPAVERGTIFQIELPSASDNDDCNNTQLRVRGASARTED